MHVVSAAVSCSSSVFLRHFRRCRRRLRDRSWLAIQRLERVRRSCFPCANRSSGTQRRSACTCTRLLRASMHARVCTRIRFVSEDKTRPMQCRGRVHRCTMHSRGMTEGERGRKRYRIVDYLKCIGNKPRRVTRCRPSCD